MTVSDTGTAQVSMV